MAGKEGTPLGARRTNIGKAASTGQKRKVSSGLEPKKKSRNMEGDGEDPSATPNPLEDLKKMMVGLGASIEGVRMNIGAVRDKLSAEIRKGNAATLE